MNRHFTRRFGGFTLIELLVVVAIIALLIAILLPSLNLAKKQALQIVCNSRLREHGKAFTLYAEDHKGWIIRGIQDIENPAVGEYTIYARSVAPYLGYEADFLPLWDQVNPKDLKDFFRDRVLFQCPSFENTSPLDYVANASPIPYTQLNIDYDAGGQYTDDDWESVASGSTDYVSASRLDDITGGLANHSDIVFVTEAHASMSDEELPKDQLRFMHFFLISQLPFGSNPRISNDDRHPGGINALFFDGHALTMKQKKFDPGWPNTVGIRGKWVTVVPLELDN